MSFISDMQRFANITNSLLARFINTKTSSRRNQLHPLNLYVLNSKPSVHISTLLNNLMSALMICTGQRALPDSLNCDVIITIIKGLSA